VQAFSIGVGGIPGILSIKSEYWMQFLLAMVIAIIIPFVLTYIIGSRKLAKEERYGPLGSEKNDKNEQRENVIEQKVEKDQVEEKTSNRTEQKRVLKAPLTGRIIPIEEVPDAVFSQKIMGNGVGIEPTGNTV